VRRELPADIGDRHLGIGGRTLVQNVQALRCGRAGRPCLTVTHLSSLRQDPQHGAATGEELVHAGE